MTRRTWKVRRGTLVALIAGSLMVGAILGPPLASSHVTTNIRHLGNHVWRSVIRAKVFTRTQSDGRYASKAHNHNPNYVAQDTCLDGAVRRAVDSPKPGQLVITELMPDTNVVDETKAEWFELRAGDVMDLNGLQIGRAVGSMDVGSPQMTVTSPNCIEVAAGSFILFARSADPALNGGLPTVDHVFTFAFTNGNPTSLFLSSQGTVLDRVVLGNPTAGSSQQVHEFDATADENDDPLNWCNSTSAYHVSNNGTPRASNQQCP